MKLVVKDFNTSLSYLKKQIEKNENTEKTVVYILENYLNELLNANDNIKLYILNNDAINYTKNDSNTILISSSLDNNALFNNPRFLNYVNKYKKKEFLDWYLKNKLFLKHSIDSDSTKEEKISNRIIKNIISSNFESEIISESICDNSIDIENFFKNTLPFEKAVMILFKTNMTNSDKLNILINTYPYNIKNYPNDFESIYNLIINRCLDAIINDSKGKNLMQIQIDLINLPYNSEFMKQVDINFKKIMTTENSLYFKIFISQLIKKEIFENNISSKSEFIYKNDIVKNGTYLVSYGEYQYLSDKFLINSNLFTKNLAKPEKFNIIGTIFHELRHNYQLKNIKNDISYKTLLFLLDQITSGELDEYFIIDYHKNYFSISYELDAVAYEVAKTFTYLDKYKYGNIYYEINKKRFLNAQKKLKEIQIRENFKDEETSLLKIVINNITPSKLVKLRDDYAVMKLIINEQGFLYTSDEILSFMASIDNNIKNFYKKYLDYMLIPYEKDTLVK